MYGAQARNCSTKRPPASSSSTSAHRCRTRSASMLARLMSPTTGSTVVFIFALLLRLLPWLLLSPPRRRCCCLCCCCCCSSPAIHNLVHARDETRPLPLPLLLLLLMLLLLLVLRGAVARQSTLALFLSLEEPFGPMLLMQLPLQQLMLLEGGDQVAGMSATKPVASCTRATSRAADNSVSPTKKPDLDGELRPLLDSCRFCRCWLWRLLAGGVWVM